MSQIKILDHPLITHKLTLMRDERTSSKDFRQLLEEITMLMGYEVTCDLPMEEVDIRTPIGPMRTRKLAGKKLAVVPILRAGLGMTDGILQLVPSARVGHIGLYRDHETHQPVPYYCKLPSDISERLVLLVDPMVATGGSVIDAADLLKSRGCSQIRLLALLGAPEGLAAVQAAHPDVDIYIAAIDQCLNENAYIVPGLGDAGDRLFGTK